MEKSTEKSSFSIKRFYRKYGIFAIFAILFIAASIFVDGFFNTTNITNILRQNSVYATLAFGATFVIILGHINLAYGSIVALTGCICCMIISAMGATPVSIILGILAAVGIGTLTGLFHGVIITKFRIPAFIATLATTEICRGIVLQITNAKPISGLGSFKVIGQGRIGFLPTAVLIMLAFFAITLYILNKTRFGRYVYAVGGNENAARASGIDTKKTVIKVFLLDGILTAFAGVLLMSRINSGYPAGGTGYEFDAITAVVVGGTSLAGGVGTLLGTFFGALIVGIINNIMNLLNIGTYWQYIVKGVIILLAVIAEVITKGNDSK